MAWLENEAEIAEARAEGWLTDLGELTAAGRARQVFEDSIVWCARTSREVCRGRGAAR